MQNFWLQRVFAYQSVQLKYYTLYVAKVATVVFSCIWRLQGGQKHEWKYKKIYA